jgi:acetoin utilization deacetylase AcuC-like enzyme
LGFRVSRSDYESSVPPVTRRLFLQTVGAGLAAPVVFAQSAQAMSTLPNVSVLSADTSAKHAGKSADAKKIKRLPTALVYDEMNKQHAGPPKRPEWPQRYDAILGALRGMKSFSALKTYQARAVTDDEILACHTADYLKCVKREVKIVGLHRLSTGDTWIGQKSFAAAEYAAGAACVGVDAVCGGLAKNVFCLSRPPGHHATASRGMGFCVFNNAAIAVRYAQKKYKIGKTLIVDWDVHHGNGTQEIFYEDPSVFYFSTHQYPWYPWTGEPAETGRGKGLGTTLNCPLKQGSGRKEFWAAFHDKLAPAARKFKPELIVISAGFDARHGDPLGKLELVDQDYTDLTAFVMQLAEETSGGRIVSLLEGGYNIAGIGQAAAAHVERLAG